MEYGQSRLAHQRFAINYARAQGGGSRRNHAAIFVSIAFCASLALLMFAIWKTSPAFKGALRQPSSTLEWAQAGEDTQVNSEVVSMRSEDETEQTAKVSQEVVNLQSPTHYWIPFQNKTFKMPPLMAKAAENHDRYITFEDDTGGWNNIRMAFEVFVVAAKVTGRILVLPPRCRFYLLDRGPITVFEKSKQGKTSSYDDYYDFNILSKHVQIITTEAFLAREKLALGIPTELVEEALDGPPKTNGHHSNYFLWLRESSDAIIWPSGPRTPPDFALIQQSKIHAEKKLIHFPMHVRQGLRYLSGVPNFLDSVPLKMKNAMKQFIRASLVYAPHIYRTANEYIRLLGGFNGFAALHIRRNELQYKSVFISGEHTATNVLPLINPGERVYLASDEMSDGFFEAFSSANVEIVRMSDLREAVAASVGFIEPKFEGMVEQVICAAGRVFAGTPYSSYSAHIMRLRQYMHSSATSRIETACLYHTKNYVDRGELEQDIKLCHSAFSGEIEVGKLPRRP